MFFYLFPGIKCYVCNVYPEAASYMNCMLEDANNSPKPLTALRQMSGCRACAKFVTTFKGHDLKPRDGGGAVGKLKNILICV